MTAAQTAWCQWFEARLERIREGSSEDYTGYEMELYNELRAAADTAQRLDQALDAMRHAGGKVSPQVAMAQAEFKKAAVRS